MAYNGAQPPPAGHGGFAHLPLDLPAHSGRTTSVVHAMVHGGASAAKPRRQPATMASQNFLGSQMFHVIAPDVSNAGEGERVGIDVLRPRRGGLQDAAPRQHRAAATRQHLPLLRAQRLQ